MNQDSPTVDDDIIKEPVSAAAEPIGWYDYFASWFHSSTPHPAPEQDAQCGGGVLKEILVECENPPAALLKARADMPDIRYAAMIGPARNAPDCVNIRELVQLMKSQSKICGGGADYIHTNGKINCGTAPIAPVLIVDQEQLDRAIKILRKTETRLPQTKFEPHSAVLREYMQRVALLRTQGRVLC